MTRTLDNSQDVIDSRDIIERISGLESLRDDAAEAEDKKEYDSERNVTYQISESGHFGEEEAEELDMLLAVQEEAEGYASDWKYGVTLIRKSYFTEYAQELADDIGATDRDAKWPNTHIDWEAAANELKQDYTEVDYNGVTYLIRCS